MKVSAPEIYWGENTDSTIDKIDAALENGHSVLSGVLFNSRYLNNEKQLKNINGGPNFNPTWEIYTHYVVIAGECDGSNKYDGYYAVADPYKKILSDSTGMSVNDVYSGLTIVRKQDLARSISGISGYNYRGIMYFND